MAYVATDNWGPPQGIAPVLVLSAYDPPDTNAHTQDMTAYVPKGTKAVFGAIEVIGTTPGHAVDVLETGASAVRCRCTLQVNAIPSERVFIVPLDSNLTFDIKATSAAVSSVSITLYAVFMGG